MDNVRISYLCTLMSIFMFHLVTSQSEQETLKPYKIDPDVLSRNKRQFPANLDEFCQSLQDGQIYPDPTDCRSYIYCSGGYAYRSSCSPGLFYSPAHQACEFDEGLCNREDFASVPGRFNDNILQPDFAIDNRDTNEVNADIKKMDQETLAAFCENKRDGTYESPLSCFHYVLCSNGAAYEGECPNGLIYSPEIHSCDFDYNAVCAVEASSRNLVDAAPTPKQMPAQLGEVVLKQMPDAVEQAMLALTNTLQDEAVMSVDMNDAPRPFKMVQRFLNAKPLAKQLSMSAFVLQNASAILMSTTKGMDLEMLSSIDSPLPTSAVRIGPDDPVPFPQPGTCPWPTYNCKIMRYRSFDGSCNNLQTPLHGRSMTPFQRFIPPNYGDGLGTLRRARHGGELPEARLVSFTVSEDRNVPHHVQTIMLMQWGQFLDHDLSHTAISRVLADPSRPEETMDITCGDDGCSQDHPNCVPIMVPSNDPVFFGKKCLEFVRSEEVPNVNCTMGAREQVNQITSFLDASNVYGSTREEDDHLREFNDPGRGKLLWTDHPDSNRKGLLPQNANDKNCEKFNSAQSCFLAGDNRVNEQNYLAVMHTMWVREHNFIEEQLHRENPQWDGETLFQESRRIVGAMMQHITYNEFLPTVLGQRIMSAYKLQLLKKDYFTGYDSSLNPSIANGFATAAFRFGHSLIQPHFLRGDGNYSMNHYKAINLREIFFRPHNLFNTDEGGIDAYVRGMCGQKIQNFDRFVTQEVTAHLFAEDPAQGLGTDLVALNIQRGRDHGIPGYNTWREWCGLRRAINFEDLLDIEDPTVRDKFRQIYRNVDDIDLFPAGLAEKPVPGGLIGPTFACIIGEQFRRIRHGDRFWYENEGAYSFTPEQLGELRKVKLAKVMCRNGDNLGSVQPNVMELPFREAYPEFMADQQAGKSGLDEEWFAKLWLTDYNKRVTCDCLGDIDFSKWKENS